ncbi:hypothetical protein K492DRAFT_188016 [Lichtheimia hyalospora FSU 10163]|nr:hypothetical protein K492DRAFT_188016 [Lichtheimia hyalospora FSU 10163]
MKSYPDQVNSYLLAGQILLDQGRLQKALETYHIGCVNVTHHDLRYQELCTALENLERQIAKEAKQTVKAQTPKKTLPFDIVSHIFSMVPVSTRVQLAATCKDWRRDLLLSGWPGMWHTIDLDGASIRNKDIVLSNIPGDQVRQVMFAIREKNIMHDTLKDIVKYNWNQVETIGPLIPMNTFLPFHTQS